MKLTDVFNSEELSDKEKVGAIASTVTRAREAYGNTEKNIETPEINTVDGLEDLAMLSNESKVAIAESEVRNIKVIATEYCKAFDGAILDRKIEELIAINPILANITASVDSAYL